jgi:CDP-glucose 4,6-dehydratase
MVSRDFWRGRRVLVTGHNGFKGSWLSLWLQSMGAEVAGLALDPPSTPSMYDLAAVEQGMLAVRGDVRDLDAVRGALASQRPEVVLHLAAQSLVRTSYESPLETYGVNVMGTATVLEAVRLDGGPRVVINVTSDKCYENRGSLWAFRESEPMGGHDPYSSSKGCSELVTSAYRASFFDDPDGPRLASARAGNVIGGGDWALDRLVPDLVRGALAGEPTAIRSPGAVRPWQHVLNPLSGYLLLAERLWHDGRFADAWNLGPAEEDARPVSWIADRMRELWGEGLEWTTAGGPAVHEAAHLKVDSSKARALMGWTPPWDLDRALASVVEWFRAHGSGQDMRAVTLEQIHAFERDGAETALPEPAR